MGSKTRLKFSAVPVALVFVLGLVLAACGGSTASPSSSDAATDITVKPSGDPKPGGSVTFAVEAETEGFNPTANRWAISGYMVGAAVFDPLAAYDVNGQWQPYLAQSFTPSADFRTWTITMRPNVSFSNGQPVDGAAVTKDLNIVRKDVLTGAALANMASVDVDPANPMQVIVKTIDPWATMPAILASQVGYIAAPAQLDAPKADASGKPIGSGPFVQKEWIPDNHWAGTRNPTYWRTDSSGNKLPYLDSVEFRPIVDPTSRVNALLSGDIQLLHTTDWASIDKLHSEAQSGSVQIVTDTSESEEAFVMLNTSKAPVDDVRVRRALALCTDAAALLVVSETPADRIADSQFEASSPYYADTNFPDNDVAAGTDLINQYKAEKGDVSLTLTTTPVPAYMNTIALLAQQWARCGVNVQQTTLEQSTFIANAVTGQYQADLWRQFGGPDPDGNYVWWTSKNATGPITLNAARLADPQIDAAIDKARASADPDVRKQAYADLQKRQTELVPYIWISHQQWAIGAAENVRNIGNVSLPDGQPAMPIVSGAFRLTQTWIDN
jgi:peptide/nickel transport system substrate-binding protein